MIHTFEFNNKKLIELGALITEKPIFYGNASKLTVTLIVISGFFLTN